MVEFNGVLVEVKNGYMEEKRDSSIYQLFKK